MNISGSYTIPVARERAYALLQDPEILAKCMPGTERLVKTGENEYEMKMKMVIAALSGLFDGNVRIEDQNPSESFRLVVEGVGKIGFVRGSGLLTLTVVGESSTSVHYAGDVHVGGTIAAIGQRLLDSTSKMMIRKFFEKLVQLAGAQPQPPVGQAVSPA